MIEWQAQKFQMLYHHIVLRRLAACDHLQTVQILPCAPEPPPKAVLPISVLRSLRDGLTRRFAVHPRLSYVSSN
jgi:hypothetical protein